MRNIRKRKRAVLAAVSAALLGTLWSVFPHTTVYAEGQYQTLSGETEENSSFVCAGGHDEVNPVLLDNLKALDRAIQGEEGGAAVYGTRMQDNAGLSWNAICPSKGNVRALVVMVEFEDVKFAEGFTKEYLEQIFFGDLAEPGDPYYPYCPKESLNAWYQRSSYGKLSFCGDIHTVTLGHTKEYYTYDEDSNPEGEDRYWEDVSAEVSGLGVNWADYDLDGDHYLDALCLVTAGGAGEWAEQWWSYVTGGMIELQDDDYQVGSFAEIMEDHLKPSGDYGDKIGPSTAIHEFGHLLGLPDLYDTSIGYGSTGMYANDMMCTDTGDFNALCKMMLGWIEAEQIRSIPFGTELAEVTLDSFVEIGDCALLFLDGGNQSIFSEYYLVQLLDFQRNNMWMEWKVEKPQLQIFHVNAELDSSGDYLLYSNRSDGSCRLIGAVDRDAEYLHGSNYASLGYNTDEVYGILGGDGPYHCGFLQGDEFTPYTAPSTGKYASDRLAASANVFSGLNVTDIRIADGKASFRVFYESESQAGKKLSFAVMDNVCWYDDGTPGWFHILADCDIWLAEEKQTAYIREKGRADAVTGVEIVRFFKDHQYSFIAKTDKEVDLEEKDYEIVFPEGMFITSYGALSKEIVLDTAPTVSNPAHAIFLNVTSYGKETDSINVRLLHGADEVVQEEYSVILPIPFSRFSLSLVPNGEYVLEISKKNHATRRYEVTVDVADVTMDVEIRLLGDVTGDGKVNSRDCNRLYAHINGTELLAGYELLCADLVGTDGAVNTRDWNRLYAHVSGASLLWEE